MCRQQCLEIVPSCLNHEGELPFHVALDASRHGDVLHLVGKVFEEQPLLYLGVIGVFKLQTLGFPG